MINAIIKKYSQSEIDFSNNHVFISNNLKLKNYS